MKSMKRSSAVAIVAIATVAWAAPTSIAAQDLVKTFDRALAAWERQDTTEAARLFRILANAGVPSAQRFMGDLYYEGKGFRRDLGEAARWYGAAAEQGNPEAAHALGHMYEDGRGVKADRVEALRWYRVAADQGDSEAQFHVADMLAILVGPDGDFGEIAHYLRLAADSGYAQAQLYLGRLFYHGREGMPRDLDQAIHYLELAAAQGLSAAQADLGFYYQVRGAGTQDPAIQREATRHLKAAADQGHARSAVQLAYHYMEARGTARDFPAAARYFRIGGSEERAATAERLERDRVAAGRGDREARVRLGDAYFFGQDTGRDFAEAARLYRLAMDQGSLDARTNLARLYLKGQGVDRDPDQALQLLRPAVAQDHRDALYVLGWMHLWGWGVALSDREAELLLRRAFPGPGGEAVVKSMLGSVFTDLSDERQVSDRRATSSSSTTSGSSTPTHVASSRTIDLASHSGWFTGPSSSGRCAYAYSNGGYRIDMLSPVTCYGGLEAYTGDAVRLSVTYRTISGADLRPGISFGREADGSMYNFSMNTRGAAQLVRWDGPTAAWTVLLSVTTAPSANTGLDATNMLSVELRGTDVRLFVNGTQIGSRTLVARPAQNFTASTTRGSAVFQRLVVSSVNP